MSLLANLDIWLQKRFIVGIVLWGMLTATGFAALAVYCLTPGELGAPPHWDSVSLPFTLPEEKHLLVMAIHPKCPCTRASLGELARLIRFAEDKLTCQLLVYQPTNAAKGWQQTALVRSGKKITDTELFYDIKGKLASQLGMTTSGSVVLYSPNGAPVFYGGITVSRNHHGDNLGSDAILSIISGTGADTRHTPVYGCSIQESAKACAVAGDTCCKEK